MGAMAPPAALAPVLVSPSMPAPDHRRRTSSRAGVSYARADHLLGRGRLRAESIEEASPAGMGWWERPDPYWETDVFDAALPFSGSPATPKSPVWERSAMFPEPDPSALPADERTNLAAVPAAAAALCADAVGRLALAGVMSMEQSAAMAGIGAKQAWASMVRPLCSAGICEASWFHPSAAPYPRVLLWRIRRGKSYTEFARRALAEGTAAKLFAGTDPWASVVSRKHYRHQVLAAETALTAMEAAGRSGTWAAWLPEGACTPDSVVPGSGDSHRVRADGALIRADGAAMFLEVQTASGQRSVEEKIERWAPVLRSAPGAVVFVLAAQPALLAPAAAAARRAVEAAVPDDLAGRVFLHVYADSVIDHCQLSGTAAAIRVASRHPRRGWETGLLAEAEMDTDRGLAERAAQAACTPRWAA